MNDTASKTSPRAYGWRIAGWIAVALLLSIPAIFRFPWSASDFVIMGMLLASVGLGIDFLVTRSGSIPVRLGLIVAVLTGFLTIWVNLAVGMIGDDNSYNLLFAVPVLVGLIGSLLSRREPRGAAMSYLGAGALQVAVGLGGYGMDPRGAVLSACFGLLWLMAALLLRVGNHGQKRQDQVSS